MEQNLAWESFVAFTLAFLKIVPLLYTLSDPSEEGW